MFFSGGLIRFIIGPGDKNFFDGERFILKAKTFKAFTGLNEGLAIKTTQGITIILTIILVALLFWFLNKTKTGKSMRAYSDNQDLALLGSIKECYKQIHDIGNDSFQDLLLSLKGALYLIQQYSDVIPQRHSVADTKSEYIWFVLSVISSGGDDAWS